MATNLLSFVRFLRSSLRLGLLRIDKSLLKEMNPLTLMIFMKIL